MKKIIIFLSLTFFSLTLFAQDNSKPYSNPIFIYGSSFGNFFKALYKVGDYESMMKFTSSKSIKEFGYYNILNYYKNMDFGYDMKLISRPAPINGISTLNYSAMIMGTKRVVKLDVTIENDSTKLVIDNLGFHLGIKWTDVY